MVMELSREGSLYKKLKVEKKFSETRTGRYMYSILQGLHFMHSQDPPILHRDLKPENLLMFDAEKVKLTDFGWSAEQSGVRNTFCGTQEYLAPEMIRGTGHDEKLDVWTLGILIFEMIHGRTPFNDKVTIGIYRFIFIYFFIYLFGNTTVNKRESHSLKIWFVLYNTYNLTYKTDHNYSL